MSLFEVEQYKRCQWCEGSGWFENAEGVRQECVCQEPSPAPPTYDWASAPFPVKPGPRPEPEYQDWDELAEAAVRRRVDLQMTIEEARRILRSRLREGTRCPCCDQHAQMYRWSLPGSAARYLIRAYRAGGTAEFLESKVLKQRGEQAMPSILSFWDLVEEEKTRRPDGGKSGWWRVTEEGERFVQGGEIPKYAFVYNRTVIRLDGEPVTISDRLGQPFVWAEHMAG